MKFWILQRVGKIGYDQAIGMVVEARTEIAARTLAAMNSGDERGDTWLDQNRSTCEELKPSKKSRLVLLSFRAG